MLTGNNNLMKDNQIIIHVLVLFKQFISDFLTTQKKHQFDCLRQMNIHTIYKLHWS